MLHPALLTISFLLWEETEMLTSRQLMLHPVNYLKIGCFPCCTKIPKSIIFKEALLRGALLHCRIGAPDESRNDTSLLSEFFSHHVKLGEMKVACEKKYQQ